MSDMASSFGVAGGRLRSLSCRNTYGSSEAWAEPNPVDEYFGLAGLLLEAGPRPGVPPERRVYNGVKGASDTQSTSLARCMRLRVIRNRSGAPVATPAVGSLAP